MSTNANVIVFVNRTAVLNSDFFGHTGWGFKLQNGNWLYGSKEATPAHFVYFPPFTIPKGKPNGVFVREASFTDMVASLKTGRAGGPAMKYHAYKLMHTPRVDERTAVQMAHDSKNWGYGVIGNNCMDDTFKIIKAYAGGNDTFLPWPSTHPLPNHFFDDIREPGVVINPH